MKRFVISFLVVFICSFSLFTGIVGPSGYLYNRSLKNRLSEIAFQADKLDVYIVNLTKQNEQLATEEGIRDAAIGLGYYVDGDKVFLFNDASKQESGNITEHRKVTELYEPVPSGTSALICAIFSLISALIYTLVRREKKDKDGDSTQERSGFNTENFDFTP
ncbi:MAG: hypothetical protein MJ052_05235 [Sphaerochaetaceae bacterium]|nr:hypothetical protein [Sphaerochaetaceae bacterium]